jgi:hypothetical protein
MINKKHTLMNNFRRRIVAICLCLLVGGYLIQIFSPLRINTDSYTLLSMAVSAYQGAGYLVDGKPAQFPIGYPFLVKTLLQIGLASSLTLVLFNLVNLFAGLMVWRVWLKSDNVSARPFLLIALILSSWVMVKHVTLPQTELFYFGVSHLSLLFAWLFYKEGSRRMWLWFAASTALAYVAFRCRTIGVVFFPMLAITALSHPAIASFVRPVLKRKSSYAYGMIGALIVLIPATIMVRKAGPGIATRGSYLFDLLQTYAQHSSIKLFVQNFLYRVLEFGEIFCNMPANRAPQMLLAVYLVGLAAWSAVLYGAYLLFRDKSFLPILIYFILYVTVLLIWPYYDPRFWLPLLPILLYMSLKAMKGLENRWSLTRFAFRAYIVWFIFLGGAALLISSRVSLSGKDFSEVFGQGDNKMSYRFAFRNGQYVDMSKVDERTVRLLRIFEPLAASNPEQEEGRQQKTPDR